jgi:hypothetical protein
VDCVSGNGWSHHNHARVIKEKPCGGWISSKLAAHHRPGWGPSILWNPPHYHFCSWFFLQLVIHFLASRIFFPLTLSILARYTILGTSSLCLFGVGIVCCLCSVFAYTSVCYADWNVLLQWVKPWTGGSLDKPVPYLSHPQWAHQVLWFWNQPDNTLPCSHIN